MSAAPNAPAAMRNRDAILEVLRKEMSGEQQVLEIGSGTGQHAVYFAAAMPQLSWQTSDLANNHEGINLWLAESGLQNVLPPKLLNVSDPDECDDSYSAIFSANTAHIMSKESVVDMFAYVGQVLQDQGKFLLYGPFRTDGEFLGEGNKRFDQSLREQDPVMGIRDLEWIDKLASQQHLSRENTYAMPANNLLLVWKADPNDDR
jgi:cyclopropane fatty-acyl-phospholipid synthase-like methyltransferase